VKKSRGLFLFKGNEMQNCKGTLTPKMPFAARFSCCATIDFNSILISSKIAKHVDVLKLFGSIALRTAGPQHL